MTQAGAEPIAVIGIGCRFPGGSSTPEAFWQRLAEGHDAIEETPPERYDINEFYHPDVNTPGKTNSRWGSFLKDIDQFDASFFGISPREAKFVDPQHRILLEVTWEALERAGVPPEDLMGSSTGVFMGIFNRDYEDRLVEKLIADKCASANAYMATGTVHGFAAGRISHLLGLRGPSMVVNTFCSSSLVAVHLACQSLRNDECRLALAGAVDLTCSPRDSIMTSKMRCLSPTGRCRTFDAGADGFVRGEGCAVLVLKRHAEALADGDAILALIRGSAVNHNGGLWTTNMLAPNLEAQQDVLRRALQNAGVGPEQISFIETHGTGTKLGDPIEFEALKSVIGLAHAEGSVCMLGSVKTNIGHLFAAAGMAGLVKSIMCMLNKAIPPHLHLETLNPRISLEHTPFVIPKHLSPWSTGPAGGSRFAGVSASGLSGTNAHVVLEEARLDTETDNYPVDCQSVGETWLLPISAKTTDGLRELAQKWLSELRSPQSLLSSAPLSHICSTASLRRTHYQQRLALVAASFGECITQLEGFIRETVPARTADMSTALTIIKDKDAHPKPVFIFSGQGAEWVGMGRELFRREKVFRSALERCDSILRRHVSWSLLAELHAEEAESRLKHETMLGQAAIFSVQVSLSELWSSWGIEPAAVVGHSVGEVAAAYVAGALDLEDAIRIVSQRGLLMQEGRGLGYMAAVEISERQARTFIDDDHASRVSIAAVNSPTSVVLSGETAALNEILEKMLRSDIVTRRLDVDCAFHSPQMERLRVPLMERLKGVKGRPGSILLLSTVTGEPESGEHCDAAYWGRNMCQPVLFGRTIEKLIDLGYTTFLEVSAHPVLARSVKQCLAHQKQSGLVLSSLRRGMNERKTMLTALGSLYTNGYAVKWGQLLASEERRKVVPLPTYPWQRSRFWSQENKPSSRDATIAPSLPSRLTTGHPLLARCMRSAATGDWIFETTISTTTHSWLADHQASGMTLFPASAYIEMMQEGVRIAFKKNHDVVRLRDLYFREALELSPGQNRVMQLVLLSRKSDDPGDTIKILSCPEDDDSDEWTLHATGSYFTIDSRRQPSADIKVAADSYTDLDKVRERCSNHTEGREHYLHMQARGLKYGPAFQGLEHIWSREGEALGRLRLPMQLASQQGSYFMHPAFLDACINAAGAAVSSNARDHSLYLPLSMDGVLTYQRPGTEIWVHIILSKSDSKQGIVVAQVNILSKGGETVALIDGLHLRRASQSALVGQQGLSDSPPYWLYKFQWDPKPHERGTVHEAYKQVSSASPRSWLLFCDKAGTGTQLAKDMHSRGEQCFVILSTDQGYQKTQDYEHKIYVLDASNPENVRSILDECMPLFKHPRCSIGYLWALDAETSADDTTRLELLQSEQQRLCGSLLHIVIAVLQMRWATSPQLWVITQNSQDVPGMCAWAAEFSSLAQAPIWGLGRVIALEHPDLGCRLVDLPDRRFCDHDRERLLDELLVPQPEDQIALRMDGRYVARLALAESDLAFQSKQVKQNATTLQDQLDETKFQFSATGTYLITGGLGGLGIAIAQWMIEQRGVRHLVLIGRRAPTPEVLSVIRQLEQHDAQILVVEADVSDHNQVAELLETIRRAGLPLRGIVHAAGVLDDGTIVQLNWARFAKVFKPKLQGSWNLHVLTQDIPLDFFVMFSSAASVVPALGQANYAAANAFLDSLAHFRRSLGLPAVSINWGPWADVGMTKDAHKFIRGVKNVGVELIDLERGMAAFEQILLDDPIQVTVLPINWAKAARTQVAPFFSKVISEYFPQLNDATISEASDDLSEVTFKEPYVVRFHKRPNIVAEDVSRIAKKVLGLDPRAPFDWGKNLLEIGVDSFTAIDLRQALQTETELSLPARLVFDYPTVEAIANYISTQLAHPIV